MLVDTKRARAERQGNHTTPSLDARLARVYHVLSTALCAACRGPFYLESVPSGSLGFLTLPATCSWCAREVAL